MNGRKVNGIFLAIVLLNLSTVVLLGLFGSAVTIGMVSNLIISQAIIFVPVMIGTFLAKENPIKLAGFHKIKISSMLMIILFTFLAMPLITLVNMISLLFVDNVVVEMSGEIIESPFFVMLFFIGILGPFLEELACRGIIYQGYKKSGSTMRAMLLSALLFSLLHMNFNQAAYAFVVGVVLILLVEATGSLWSAVLFHVIFNSWQVCSIYLVKPEASELLKAQEQLTKQFLLTAISGYLIIAAITTAIAACVLVWIAKNEKREEELRAVWSFHNIKADRGEKMVTVPLVLAIVLCLTFMSLYIILS